jgi:hypothetical protein
MSARHAAGRWITDRAAIPSVDEGFWGGTDACRRRGVATLIQARLLCLVRARPMGTTVTADAVNLGKFARIVSAT